MNVNGGRNHASHDGRGKRLHHVGTDELADKPQPAAAVSRKPCRVEALNVAVRVMRCTA
jgi:hypothetical protein